MVYFNFDDLVDDLTAFTIEENRKYWFVRTVGGKYYQNFLSGRYVAIGYNEIYKRDLDMLPKKEESALMELKSIYKSKHPG